MKMGIRLVKIWRHLTRTSCQARVKGERYTQSEKKTGNVMATVHDVAAYILELQSPMTTMKLQKLCYYSQGWSLAWDGLPVFKEPIQAWANGPVVYELFKGHQGVFKVEDWPQGDPSQLSDSERETIRVVVDAYGKLTGQQLSYKAHSERPWLEARGTLPEGSRSTTRIKRATMQDYFGGLANAQ